MCFLDRGRDFFGAPDREGAIGRALNLARDRDLNVDLDSALQVARTLASELKLDRAPVLDQARALARGLVSDLASYPTVPDDPAADFARYRDLAQDLARYLDQRSVDAEGSRPLPRRVQLAVWLLPRSWQPRYCEEFGAELARLPRRERNKYAWRVLADAWRLRKELVGRECPPDGARVEG